LRVSEIHVLVIEDTLR